MRELFLFPEIQSYKSFTEFVQAHQLGEGDLILTTEPVLNGIRNHIPEEVRILCTEQYGSGEPSDEMFDALLKDAYDNLLCRVIAIGGGSCIDMAKMLCACDGMTLDRVFETDPDKLEHKKKLIVIPTTCGTGSEVTVTAVFNRKSAGTKMGLTNYALRTDYAVLIPELLDTLPSFVYANSSIDALIHAIESYLDGAQATNGSRMFAEKAIDMILPIYRVLRDTGMEERTKYMHEMQLASLYAGVAIANALPSASHAMSYPFADKFHRPHGEACYVFLDATLQKYLQDVNNNRVTEKQKMNWKAFMNLLSKGLDMPSASDEKLLAELDQLLSVICPKKTLREYGATKEDCMAFGKSCYEKQQRLMQCAFSPFTEKELIETFVSVW